MGEVGKQQRILTHNVLQLFQFPSLEATLTTVQHHCLDGDEHTGGDEDSRLCGVVESRFDSHFYDAVGVQTDFNAQVSFLPELLRSYGSSQVGVKCECKVS